MFARPAALAALALLSSGCGDVVADEGDFGLLTYSLFIDYEIDGGLRDNRLVTGHAQTLDVGLTKKGGKKAKEPGLITHKVSPAATSEVFFDPGDDTDDDPPALFLTASETGDYTVESYYEGEIFDTITIEFGKPKELEVQTWLRPAGSERFESVSAKESQDVSEGDQIAFLTIPLDARGKRLVGNYAVDVAWTPEEAAVQTYNVLGVYEEEGVFGSLAERSLVFVDPASVEVTLTDSANGMVDQRTFVVSDNGF